MIKITPNTNVGPLITDKFDLKFVLVILFLLFLIGVSNWPTGNMAQSTPAPTTSRANYGFALYLGSSCALALYLVWAVVPDSILHALGLTYWPQKYWALAIPIHFLVTLVLFVACIYPAINLMLTPPINDSRIISDEFSITADSKNSNRGIPAVSDLPIADVCRNLYLSDNPHVD